MSALPEPTQTTHLRAPTAVMRLSRMGAAHQTRLSFMRTLIRRMHRENWIFERLRFDMDGDGFGSAVFAAHTPTRTYSLAVFTQDLEPQNRTDRVIAEAWDATFNLFDGVPSDADMTRLAANTPKQEAGRFLPSELVLARANKSLRLFEHVVERLATGRQPDVDTLAGVGYLMRTTAVYGSGKFGSADREKIAERPEMKGAFQAEMLAVYLIRWFTIDLVEHVARARGGDGAVRLDPAIKRFLGIGNATGLGMAPFLVKYPVLVNNWVLPRETALARVRAVRTEEGATVAAFRSALARARRHLVEWNVEDAEQTQRIEILREEMRALEARVADPAFFDADFPWERIYGFAEERFSEEGQELTVTLLLEPQGDRIDDLADGMNAVSGARLEPAMNVEALRANIDAAYDWALVLDLDDPVASPYFWYYSEDKLEPRLGRRDSEPGADLEMPLTVAGDVQALRQVLAGEAPETPVMDFVARHPEFRYLVRRVQTVARHPYAEIRDNLVGADLRPLDLLRFKLAFFGASKFDPKSDLWTRITMYQGAPAPDEIARSDADDWAFPVKPEVSS